MTNVDLREGGPERLRPPTGRMQLRPYDSWSSGMTMRQARPAWILPGLMMLIAVACTAAEDSNGGGGRAVPSTPASRSAVESAFGAYAPEIRPEDFVSLIDNPYMPMQPGTTRVYEGGSDGEREVVKVTVTDRTREILGVSCIVVRDEAWIDGQLHERTFDWFAQDAAGNVWYFGERTAEYEHGKVVSRSGSWQAGVDGAQPGIVMLADPSIDTAYRQEFYEGEAEDKARVIALDEQVSVPLGAFGDVLVTEDWTPLEPAVLEQKHYAPGFGVVFERLVEGGSGVLRLVEIR